MLTIAFAVLLLAAPPAHASCNDPAKEPSVTFGAPGNPFQALPTADGCWVFVSFTRGGPRVPAGIALYKRSGGTLQLERVLRLIGGPTGMALTHDEKLLVVADGDRTAFIDADRFIHGRGSPLLGYQIDSAATGRVYANVSPDDKYAFIADEQSRTVSVIELQMAHDSHYDVAATMGKIPTGTLPIALTFSNDGKFAYLTSQWAPESYHWPIECKRETNNPTNDSTPVNPQGAIHIVDVARTRTDPAHAIVGNVPAGCSAVRLVLSPTGDRAYVTARNSNMLLVFDVAKLHSDSLHALIARVPVGSAPVGIAVVNGGKQVIVTNSNRFAGSAEDHQSLTVIDATKVESGASAIVGSIPAGAFPREMRVTADGRTLILTNFGSQTIQMIDLARIPGAR